METATNTTATAKAKTAPKKTSANVRNETIEKLQDLVGRLYDRWQDEQGLEDFADYQKAAQELLPDGATAYKMTAEPFEVSFIYQNTAHRLVANKGTVRHFFKAAGKANPKKAAPAKKVVKTAKVAPKKTAAPAKTEATGNELNLKQLCNQLSKQLKVDIDPRMARRKLRKAKITGHDFRDRWTFLAGSKAYEAAVAVLTPAKDEE